MFQVPLAGQSINTASVGIDTTITSGNISCTNISAVNGTINNLTTTIFNPASITTTTLDTVNLTVSNSIPVLNVQTLNVSTKNVSQINVLNASMTNMSVQNLSCTNFTSPDVQHILTAGENISILNNVITASSNGLIPSNINFSSINTSSLTVNNDVIIGGTTYITDLIVSDQINCSEIVAANLSTAEMTFGNSLTYIPSTKTLDVNTTDTISSGNTLPITSGAVYNSINTATTTISTMWSYMLSESEFILVATSVAAGGENTICYLDITPQYEGSKIHVEFCLSYSVGGHGTDSIVTEIRVGTNNNNTQTVIQEIFQEWDDNGGGGTRSGTGSTIAASYTNNDSLGKYHRIQLRIDNNSDDSWGLDNAAFVSIKVIEFIETAGTSNPNILIGNGNISCGNLSCNTISITNHTIDNLITTQNVNVGGSMVTVGFPESGTIVPSSMVRLAGGSVVSNYADMAWDGSTFNISTRQATKNFKVSFGQVAYLEVDSTNVSVQSLKVNQTLEVLGTLIYNDLILNDSLLLNGTFSAFGATFRDDVIFERDVDIEQTLNVSNINVSGNVVCGGTITGSNLSTVALIPGSNITIVNDVISAFVESDADIVVSSLHVDNDVDIYGILNVSQTSNFGQSLNVDNQLFVGKSGTTNGDVVLYSTNIGDNFEIQNGVTETSFLGTGNISKFNFSLAGNQTVTISPSQINISGDLVVNGNISGTLDFQNLSATNLSVVNLTVDLIQGDLNAGDMFASSLTTTGHIETGKWWIGASSTTTASLYNTDITSVDTHYALRQTNGGGTSINGTAVYFKNNGTDVGEWTATGLGVGKTNPTSTLDVSGDSFFAGEVDIVGDLTTENISATTLTTTGHVETGKWFLGALNTTTSELYNKDVTSSTTHYALRQTNGGSTSLNGAEIYFKNNSVIIAEINATGLCIGKTTPTAALDVSGNTLITGNVNICGILDADDIVLDNISNTNFSGNQITANQIDVAGHIETGKWLIGASDTTTSSLYNKDITSVTTHYALRQTNGGGTSLNGTAVYFKNNGTDVGEWTATGLSIGKTTPEYKLDVLGDASIYGTIFTNNVCTPILSNVSFIKSIGTIEFKLENGTPTLDINEQSTKFYHDVNISGTLRADAISNINCANASFTNISTTRITANTINSSFVVTPTLLNVSYLWSDGTIDFRTNTLPTLAMNNVSAKFFQDVNISGTLRADAIEGIDLLNICSTNISTSNLSTNKITFLTTYGLYQDFTGATNVSLAQVKGDILSALGATFSATTLNSSTLNSSVIKARNIYVQDLGASINFSAAGVLNNNLTGCVTNLKECNISTLNASIVNGANLSTATMEFGTGLTFALNTLSADFTSVEQTIANEIATEVDTALIAATTANIGFLNVDGNANISNLNVSNISCINLSCTEITTTDDGINKIGKLTIDNDGDVVRINYSGLNILSHNTVNTNTVLTAGNEIYFIADGSTQARLGTTGLKIGSGGATEKLDVGGNAKISGELTASTVKHSDDFCRFYKSNNTELTSAQTSYLNVFETTSLSSTKVTQTTTSRYTINKAGYYKIFANMIYENTSYNERVVYRGQLLVNGNSVLREYGDSFVYTRDSRFGEIGSAPVATLLNLSVNDYIEVYVTLKKASGPFGGTMDGCRVRLASDIAFEYLGT